MNRMEAEDFVYQSYMKCSGQQNYYEKDRNKRHPEFTRDVIRGRAGTPCAVVTGSKGKGSVANMISQILQTEYKVGLMTSPHLTDFCERFKIDGRAVSDEEFAEGMTSIKGEIERIEAGLGEAEAISPIGIQTDFALKYFNDHHTEFNVLECGKGARYDDVNNALHQYAVINTIFLEHVRELGDTLEEIALDKAHVITGEQKAVYIAGQEYAVLQIILERAKKYEVSAKLYGRDFWAEQIRYTGRGMRFDVVTKKGRYEGLELTLLGEHQAKNCALALALCEDVLEKIRLDAVKQKLKELRCPGRMEIISDAPLTILDACIHRASCGNIKNILKSMKIGRITAVIGIPDDKDYRGVAAEMSEIAGHIILTKSRNPHYVFTADQEKNLREEGYAVKQIETVEEAINEAVRIGDPIVIVGTTSVVSEVERIDWMKLKRRDVADGSGKEE